LETVTQNLVIMNLSEKLYHKELETLLQFPAYILLQENTADGIINTNEIKRAAIVVHSKIYTSPSILQYFYKELDKIFEEKLYELNEDLPKESHKRKEIIEKELNSIEKILQKLGNDYSEILHKSMESFKSLLSKSHSNSLDYSMYIYTIKGANV
jgi:uncharacterized protein YicC (UPF0701 family)